jgi:hypothetical protein
VTAPTDRRLVLVALAVFTLTVAGLLVWAFRVQLFEAAFLLMMGRLVYRRAFPVPRGRRRGKSLREWFDTGLLALIAYRLPPRAKRERINTRPVPVYRGERAVSRQLGADEPWPEDVL